MKWLTATAVLLVAMSVVAAEDKLLLKDGQTVTGTILSMSGNDVQIDTGTEKMRVPRWAIETIERGESKVNTAVRGTAQSGARGARALPPRESVESTPALNTWIDVLVEKLGSEDPGVQATATAALRAAGPAARVAIERATQDEDQRVAGVAKRILSNIDFVSERQSRQRMSPHDRDHIGILMTSVKVTDEQTPEFKRIMNEFYARQSEIAASIRKKRTSVADGGKQIQKLRAELDSELATILTETQMAAYRTSVPRPSNRAKGVKR